MVDSFFSLLGTNLVRIQCYRHCISMLSLLLDPARKLKHCDYVNVEADSHLKLLLTSILDIYKVFEHIDMLFIGIQYQPYTVLPTLLGSDFGVHQKYKTR